MVSSPALQAQELGFAYPGGPPVLADVSLTVGVGELVCVLGPNGAGKSSLLKVLGGLLKPDRGEVHVFGRRLAELGARERARLVASVPQNLQALPNVLVEHFVLGGRYPHLGLLSQPGRHDRQAVADALREADAEDFRGRPLHALSGGQFQRVLLARALAQEARVLLFDEPTASLDPEHQVSVFAGIARLVEGGRAALIATHELNLASRFATRLVVLAEGRIRARGSVAEVLRPDVLEPVYGPDILFQTAPGPPPRPLVVPWPRREEGPAR